MTVLPVGSRRWLALLAAVTLAGLITFLGGERLPADDKPAAPQKPPLPADLELVPPDAMAFVSIRVKDLWQSEAARRLRRALEKEGFKVEDETTRTFGAPVSQIDRLTVLFLSPRTSELMIISSTQAVAKKKLLDTFSARRTEKKVGNRTYYEEKARGQALYIVSDRVWVRGNVSAVDAYLRHVGTGKLAGPLHNAARLAMGKRQVVAGLNVSLLASELAGAGQQLPKEMEPFLPLLKAKLATLTVDLSSGAEDRGTEIKISAQAYFDEEDEAKEGAKAADKGLDLARGLLDKGLKEWKKDRELAKAVKIFEHVQAGLKKVKARQNGKNIEAALTVRTDEIALGAAVTEAVMKVREAANKVTSANNLKQMGIAFHAFNDATGRMPANAIYSKDGKPLLSWRVAILPYIEQNNLYKQFHLDEPWDSEHNKKLLAKMPTIYAPPGVKTAKPYTTFYQVFTGANTPFNGKVGGKIPASFPDGASNTFLIVEAGKAVPWTKPEDIPFNANAPVPKLGGIFKNFFQACFADGHVQVIRKTIKQKVLRNLIDPADGNPIEWNDVP